MEGLSRKDTLEALRARIEGLEKRPVLAEPTPCSGISEGFAFALPGVLHEVFADEQRDCGAALGFALGQAKLLLNESRRAILILQLNRDGQNLGVPYGDGLVSFGIDPVSIVLCRMDDPVDLLWAMEEAIACRAVAGVIADVGHPLKDFDFTASRRLSLRAAESGSSAFVVRFGRNREASASRFRWHVMPTLSAPRPFDARAPNMPRWHVHLEKGRLGSRRDPVEWVLDWTENGFVLAEPSSRNAVAAAAAEADSRPLPAPLGHRLSEAG